MFCEFCADSVHFVFPQSKMLLLFSVVCGKFLQMTVFRGVILKDGQKQFSCFVKFVRTTYILFFRKAKCRCSFPLFAVNFCKRQFFRGVILKDGKKQVFALWNLCRQRTFCFSAKQNAVVVFRCRSNFLQNSVFVAGSRCKVFRQRSMANFEEVNVFASCKGFAVLC